MHMDEMSSTLELTYPANSKGSIGVFGFWVSANAGREGARIHVQNVLVARHGRACNNNKKQQQNAKSGPVNVYVGLYVCVYIYTP